MEFRRRYSTFAGISKITEKMGENLKETGQKKWTSGQKQVYLANGKGAELQRKWNKGTNQKKLHFGSNFSGFGVADEEYQREKKQSEGGDNFAGQRNRIQHRPILKFLTEEYLIFFLKILKKEILDSMLLLLNFDFENPPKKFVFFFQIFKNRRNHCFFIYL